MPIKRILSLAVVLTLTASLFTGCAPKAETTEATDAPAANEPVKITFLNTKGEIQSQLEETVKVFTEANPNITVEVLPASAGQSPFEKVSSMYASGNAPTLSMLDGGDVLKFTDKFADLSSEKWVSDAAKGSLDDMTIDGKVKAFPMTVEGYGLIYNKAVVEKALGTTFDPKSIQTRAQLEDFFKKIKASGTEALVISPMDWSLGAHLLTIGYADQSADTAAINSFIDSMKSGSGKLSSNVAMNGLLDTFDMMKKYNVNGKDPLSSTYEKDAELIGSGNVATWFMGNWAWPNISQFSGTDAEFGFLPIPVSDNASDYGNNSIPVGASKFVSIDTTQNTPEQQAAAKLLLDWFVYDAKGQDMLVNTCNILPAFTNNTLPAKDPMSANLKAYMNEGNIIKFMVTLPSDHWSNAGASMQKYLAGKADRATLLKEIEAYWQSVQ